MKERIHVRGENHEEKTYDFVTYDTLEALIRFWDPFQYYADLCPQCYGEGGREEAIAGTMAGEYLETRWVECDHCDGTGERS